MIIAGILLIAVPFIGFVLSVPWANSTRRKETQGPALALRLTAVYFAVCGLGAAIAIGLFTASIGPTLTAIGIGAMGLMLAVLIMDNGDPLAGVRSLDRWEILSLRWLLGASALAGVVVLLYPAITGHRRLAIAVVAVALSASRQRRRDRDDRHAATMNSLAAQLVTDRLPRLDRSSSCGIDE